MVGGFDGVGGAFQWGGAGLAGGVGEVGEERALSGEAFEAFVGAAGAGVGVPPLAAGERGGGGVLFGGGALVQPVVVLGAVVVQGC